MPVSLLKQRLTYDARTGEIRWLPLEGDDRETRRWNSRYAGNLAGGETNSGYLDICFRIEGQQFLFRAHRVAWALKTGCWPAFEVDHENNDRVYNAWVNLRPATHGENGKNKTMSRANTSGYKGVTLRQNGHWRAQILVDGIKISLGHFQDPRNAAKAYDRNALLFFGKYAKTNAMLGLL